jgi:hypothetical protein
MDWMTWTLGSANQWNNSSGPRRRRLCTCSPVYQFLELGLWHRRVVSHDLAGCVEQGRPAGGPEGCSAANRFRRLVNNLY